MTGWQSGDLTIKTVKALLAYFVASGHLAPSASYTRHMKCHTTVDCHKVRHCLQEVPEHEIMYDAHRSGRQLVPVSRVKTAHEVVR